jgi:hypothetical protein
MGYVILHGYRRDNVPRREAALTCNLMSGFSDTVQGTVHSQRSQVSDVGVDHRRLDAAMTQELLDGPDVVACL